VPLRLARLPIEDENKWKSDQAKADCEHHNAAYDEAEYVTPVVAAHHSAPHADPYAEGLRRIVLHLSKRPIEAYVEIKDELVADRHDLAEGVNITLEQPLLDHSPEIALLLMRENSSSGHPLANRLGRAVCTG
jgi:hypothetical protein